MEPEPKSGSHSETRITELMIPSYSNFGGKIHGGILLALMDKVAYACAAKYTGAYCVTVSVDTVDFKAPVEVGELVSLFASVNYTGRTSLVVGIRVEAENVKTGVIKHTNTSYFTMVAKDDSNKPTPVPPLILETPDAVRRFVESIVRKYNRQYFEQEMERIKSDFNLKDEVAKLEGERCEVRVKV